MTPPPASYSATITTGGAQFVDHGAADPFLVASIQLFREGFASTMTAPVLTCEKFKTHPNDPSKDKCQK